jgi:hypothetical protein
MPSSRSKSQSMPSSPIVRSIRSMAALWLSAAIRAPRSPCSRSISV